MVFMVTKRELYINSYTNKKGEEKISINVSYYFARSLANLDSKALEDTSKELKKYLDKKL